MNQFIENNIVYIVFATVYFFGFVWYLRHRPSKRENLADRITEHEYQQLIYHNKIHTDRPLCTLTETLNVPISESYNQSIIVGSKLMQDTTFSIAKVGPI